MTVYFIACYFHGVVNCFCDIVLVLVIQSTRTTVRLYLVIAVRSACSQVCVPAVVSSMVIPQAMSCMDDLLDY